MVGGCIETCSTLVEVVTGGLLGMGVDGAGRGFRRELFRTAEEEEEIGCMIRIAKFLRGIRPYWEKLLTQPTLNLRKRGVLGASRGCRRQSSNRMRQFPEHRASSHACV